MAANKDERQVEKNQKLIHQEEGKCEAKFIDVSQEAQVAEVIATVVNT